jgi:carboxymethylenebutenolidase
VTGSYFEVPLSDGARMPAYFAEGAGDGPRAAIVVLQEIFGVNANMRLTAEAFAALGYDTIVPDLFWRQEPRVELDPATDYARATELMKGLDQPQAVDDALAAGGYLRGLPRSNGKTGAVGYCLGGKLAFLAAMDAQIAAAVSYYGVAIDAVLDRADSIKAPMLVHIGEKDALCPPEAQLAIHRALDGRPDLEIMDHPGVGHAFARRGGAAYDEAAAKRADTATFAFFARHLG